MSEVRITKAGFSADGQFLNVTAKSEDHGPHNEVQVHVWDGAQADDVPLRWVAKAGTDDVFEGKIPVSDLNNRTFNLFELGATGRMTEPNAGPFWEGRDHTVLPDRHDRTVAIRRRGATNPVQGRSEEPVIGPLEVTVQREPVRGNAQGGTNQAHLTHLRWTNQDPGNPGPEKMEVAIFASLQNHDARGLVSTTDQRRRYNIITLDRQPDGTYQATAPAGRAFISVQESNGAAGTSALVGFKFALHDPNTGVWDKGLHQEYFVGI